MLFVLDIHKYTVLFPKDNAFLKSKYNVYITSFKRFAKKAILKYCPKTL